ncbi:AAA family ATPase [Bacillus sp. CGMCC 1.16541]|uniref:AAA family ATPase n=1 Tax=Bacillus sp. CGMCC 1.16541 TaxID=2185143 RepID=UPI000D732E1F|nr:AAA family ATPase [Bacillus sp. CGMCC 1.16541]
MKRGVVLGKFMPLHLGHEHLIKTGVTQCDELTVVVCTLSTEPIDGELRFQWMKQRFKHEIAAGRLRVFHLKEDWIPQEPSDCYSREVFYGTWAGVLKAIVGAKIDYMFASEEYVYPVSHYIACEPVLVDVKRETVPVSGTMIRTQPFKHWNFMNEQVRTYFSKKILIIGGESTGKSTLTTHLADHYKKLGYLTSDIQEYARDWIDTNLDGDMEKLTFDHITHFGVTQNQLVEKQKENPNVQLVFSDTDAIVSSIFQEIYFGRVSKELRQVIENEQWDCVLFTQPDVDWIDDGQRNLFHRRLAFRDRVQEILLEQKIEYIEVKGTWKERFSLATKAIDLLIGR